MKRYRMLLSGIGYKIYTYNDGMLFVDTLQPIIHSYTARGAWEYLTYNDKLNMNYDEFINKLKMAVIR